MASKGQRFGKYSYDIKMELVNKYLNNEGGYTSLAKEYNIPFKTVVNWILFYNTTILKSKKSRR